MAAGKQPETMSVTEARAYFASGGKAKAKVKRKKSAIEKQLEEALQRHRIHQLEKATGQQVTAEHEFHPERKWRFDFFLPQSRIAIEVEGGVWVEGGGRHNRGKGFVKDLDKYNSAQAMGFKVLRFTPDQLLQPKAISIIKQAIRLSEIDTHKQELI